MESFCRLTESEFHSLLEDSEAPTAVTTPLQRYCDNMASLCPTARKFPQLLEDSEELTVDPLPGDSGDCFESSRVLPIIPELYYDHDNGRSIPIPLLHIQI
jgi:hypothetical protein